MGKDDGLYWGKAMSDDITQLKIDIAEIKGQLCTLNEIKTGIDTLTRSMTGFREQYIKEYGVLENKANTAHARIDEVYKEIEIIKKTQEEISKLVPFVRSLLYVVTGVSIPLTLAVIYWVWSLITHTP